MKFFDKAKKNITDKLNELNLPLNILKPAAKQSSFTTVQTIDGYTFLFDGNSVDILKNKNDYFNGEIVLTSHNSNFQLLKGFKGDLDSVALISRNQLIALKKDCYFDFGFISDTGIAVFSDEENIIILSKEKQTKHQVTFPLEKSYSVLNDNYCVFTFYDEDTLFIKCVDMNTLQVSSFEKSLEYIKSADEHINVSLDNNILSILFNTNDLLKFNLEKRIKQIQ